MKRIDSRTVELTTLEESIKMEFEEFLSDGLGIQDAAIKALENYHGPRIDKDFVEYLSDGTVASLTKRRFHRVVSLNERPVKVLHPAPTHRRVTQYGPDWMAHVTAGGGVIDGNNLVL